MAKISNLQELYVDELNDLWSANDQMSRALKLIEPHATNTKLKTLLQKSPEGITRHTVDDAPEKGPVLDAAIIAQYQRMTHYGITGFGTVAAFARALKLRSDSDKLETAVKDMHQADDLMSELAEAAVNVNATKD